MSIKNSQEKDINWDWVRTEEGEFIQSKALINSGFKHGFFTRNWQDKTPQDLIHFLDENYSVHITKQVHGNNVIKASMTDKKSYPNSDGLISDKNFQSLWVYSADCIPILFADKDSGQVGVCHAGWRGAINGIIEATITSMENLGSKRNNIISIIGPTIQKESYEIKIR